MSGASMKFNQETCRDSTSATSSPESADGPSRSGSQESQTTGRCGPEAAHASPSASQECSGGSPTRATSGQSGSSSSVAASLHSSLASRLKRRSGSATTASLGSNSSNATWLRVATRLGLQYSRLHTWAPRTNASGCTSWPTPVASDHSRSVSLYEGAWMVASGQAPNGFFAQMGRGARLNPELVLWLMGYPAEWMRCAARATQSFRSRLRSSSKPTSRHAGKSKGQFS